MKEFVRPDDTRDLLRAIGAVLFGLGILVLSVRKDEPTGFVDNDGWGHGALLIMYLIPAVVLFGGAIMSVRETGGLRKWQAVASVFGLLFIPSALSELVNVFDGNASAPLNVFWIAGVTAAAAFYAGLVAGVRFQLLAGSIAALVAYLALWDKILSDGVFNDLTALRWILLAFAAALLVGGIAIWRRDGDPDGLWRGSELLTGAGIAAIGATLVISTTGPITGAVSDFFASFGATGASGGENPSLIWDVAGLIVVLALIVAGAEIGSRGPVYVGAIGLIFFAIIVGQNLDADPGDRENGFVGWPLILLVLGGGALLLSGLKDASQGDRPKNFVKSLRGG